METIDTNQKHKEVTIKYDAVGWKSLLQKRAGTSRILILKSVVRGLCLERGMPIYSYTGEDADGRPVMIAYLDGKPRIIKQPSESKKPECAEKSSSTSQQTGEQDGR
jgi:hypothetical protein